MKFFFIILILAGLAYIGLQVKEDYGEPIKEALNIEDTASEEDMEAVYQSKLVQLQRQVFGPLSKSSRAIQVGPLLRQVSEDAEAEKISRKTEARIRHQISALQKAMQERNQFATQYRSITQPSKRSFDEGVKDRRVKLQQEDIERRWAETSKRLEAAYERNRSAL